MAMGIRNPYFPALANTWSQRQTYPGGLFITSFFAGGVGSWLDIPTSGDSGIGSGGAGNNPWLGYAKNAGAYISNSQSGDIIIGNFGNGNRLLLASNQDTFGIEHGVLPSASNPTFASGTIYQNTTASYQRLIVPVYASTSGTAGTAAVALGTSSTPGTIATEYISGSTSSTAQKVLESCATIPPGWYYSITLTGASFGTITQIQM
jgi:hypothetical protein